MNKEQMQSATLTDLSIKELLALFRRRRGLVIGMVVLGLAVAGLVSLLMPPAYQHISLVLVDGPTQANPNRPDDIVGAIAQSNFRYDVLTQIAIMESFDLRYKALTRINYPLPKVLTQEEFDRLPQVTVTQVQTTNNVLIAVEAEDKDVARALGEALPVVYAEYVEEQQKDQVSRTVTFIDGRLEEEHLRQREAEQQFADFRSQNQIGDSKTESDVRVGQLAEAQRKLSEAQAGYDGAQAALIQAREAYNSTSPTVANPTTLTRVEAIERAEDTLTQLNNARDALLVNNYEDSERIKRLDAQISAQQARLKEVRENRKVSADTNTRNPLRDEFERSMRTSQAVVDASRAQVERWEQVVAQREDAVRNLGPLLAKLRSLETRIGESQLVVQRLLETQNAIRLRSNDLPKPITNLTGKAPARLIRPNIVLNMVLGLLGGIVLGVAAALIRDTQLDKVNTTEEAVAIAEKDILGRVPIRSSSRDPLISDPQKARAFEAYRVLRNSIVLMGGDAPGGKAYVVTSSVPREGKTTVAGNLAVAMALEGKRTVLIDGNVRNPGIHKLFKTAREKGLTEVLEGKITADEALKTTEIANLAVITAGADAANPTELIASEQMKQLVEKLKGQVDYVLIDAPSSFGLADAQSLVHAAKDVVFITQLEGPSKTQMRESVGMIDFAGGNIVGVVINKDRLATSRARAAI
ncbi:MAG: polysaccharide biosynthesis tyrosine autokinase [Fimbriimonadaceae bacterium]|nr:polysaccharide biosynthesis tyrosine autokinase [Fimbriimonadaceae bacterium]QYK57016.1 MAG: polysaccharide biosynthesis tyrosine autokinase [Fimbriimonadaceae bacterium]